MVLPSSGSSVFIRTSRTNRSYTEEMERQLDNLENNFVHKYTDSDLGEDISGNEKDTARVEHKWMQMYASKGSQKIIQWHVAKRIETTGQVLRRLVFLSSISMPEFFYGNGKKDSDMSDEDLLGHMVDLAKMEGHPSMDGLLSSGSGFDTSIF
eukprot:jgi/Bigna1/69083/fgenesh1_pg.8_\